MTTMNSFSGKVYATRQFPVGNAHPTNSLPTSPTSYNHKQVLIVDDDVLARGVLRLLFESDGYHCHEAENGAVGLKMLERYQADLVVTDVQMPILNGIEFLHCIMDKFNDHAPPVIVMTGFLTQAIQEEAFHLGACAVLGKPCDLMELRSIATDTLQPSTPASFLTVCFPSLKNSTASEIIA